MVQDALISMEYLHVSVGKIAILHANLSQLTPQNGDLRVIIFMLDLAKGNL